MMWTKPPGRHIRSIAERRWLPNREEYTYLEVTQSDLLLATAAFGWTLGIGVWAFATAWKQTRRFTIYILLCWLELVVCVIFSVICWLYLLGPINPSIVFFLSIVTCWALQVQFLLQIIVNRICVLLPHPQQRRNWKFRVAAIITAVNISVYCIWVPAKLQIHPKFHWINLWWDRVEKVIYLIVDGALNYMFIRTVKHRLLSLGLKKYDRLVRFNVKIVWLSLSMDVLIITMMSHPNDFVYMQFHPVAYLVKLQIEMTMSNLIVKIARAADRQISTQGDGRSLAWETASTSGTTSAQNRAGKTRQWNNGLPLARGISALDPVRTSRAVPVKSLLSIELGEISAMGRDEGDEDSSSDEECPPCSGTTSNMDAQCSYKGSSPPTTPKLEVEKPQFGSCATLPCEDEYLDATSPQTGVENSSQTPPTPCKNDTQPLRAVHFSRIRRQKP